MGIYPGTLTTLDGLVAALTSQQGWAEVTAPSDISIDGYAGKHSNAPPPPTISDCDLVMSNTREDVRSWNPTLTSWETRHPLKGWLRSGFDRDLVGPRHRRHGRRHQHGRDPGPSAEASPEFAADVLDSIRIERA